MILKEKDLTPENVGVIAQFFDKPIEELVALSDLQKVLIKNFKDAYDALRKASIGIVRNDNLGDLYFLNMEHISDISADAHVNDNTDYL